MSLFWAAATYKPKKKSKEEEEKAEELVLEPKIIVAKSETAAAMKITVTEASKLGKYDLDRVNIFIRPF